jgi:hypothetical protein
MRDKHRRDRHPDFGIVCSVSKRIVNVNELYTTVFNSFGWDLSTIFVFKLVGILVKIRKFNFYMAWVFLCVQKELAGENEVR